MHRAEHVGGVGPGWITVSPPYEGLGSEVEDDFGFGPPYDLLHCIRFPQVDLMRA